MTRRLYYDDPSLLTFTSRVSAVRVQDGRTMVALDESAFYPTSGGQPFDTGTMQVDGAEVRVVDVSEDESDVVWHTIENATPVLPGATIIGEIDPARRRDHRQQHSGQHLLSAILLERFGYATVSFHLGAESSTIDIDSEELTAQQLAEAVERCNHIIAEDHALRIHYGTREEAFSRGVRKIASGIEHVRMIEIEGIEFNACGGTHVASTGAIGSLLTRKVERVKQGTRIEFVCGSRAVRTAARDYAELRSAGETLSSAVWAVTDGVQKLVAENRAAAKQMQTMRSELAESLARQFAMDSERLHTRFFSDRDVAFVKLLAQNLIRIAQRPTIVLFAAALPAPAIVFARTDEDELRGIDMGVLVKKINGEFGGKGGGSATLAQGGVATADLDAVLDHARRQIT